MSVIIIEVRGTSERFYWRIDDISHLSPLPFPLPNGPRLSLIGAPGCLRVYGVVTVS